MSKDSDDWVRRNRGALISAVVAIVLLPALYFLTFSEGSIGSRFGSLIRDLVPNGIALALAFVFATVLFLRERPPGADDIAEALTERLGAGGAADIAEALAERLGAGGAADLQLLDDIGDVPWKALFEDAMSVEIVARFFDGPLMDAGSSLGTFFDKGGALAIATIDPEDAEELDRVDRQRRPQSTGSQLDPHHVEVRLKRGLQRLIKQFDQATSRRRKLETYFLDVAPNYAAYIFDSKVFVLVPYELWFDEDVRAPHVLLRGQGVTKGFKDFLSHEWSEIRRHYPDRAGDLRALVDTWVS